MEEGQYNRLKELTDDENDMLDLAFGLTDTSRLGCQVSFGVPTCDFVAERLVDVLLAAFHRYIFNINDHKKTWIDTWILQQRTNTVCMCVKKGTAAHVHASDALICVKFSAWKTHL